MIKTIRKKMILSTMIVVIILIIVMIVIINGINFITLNLEADALLDEVVYYFVPDHPEDPDLEQNPDSDSESVSAGDSEGDSAGIPQEILDGETEESLNSNNGFDIQGRNKNIFSFLLPDIKKLDVLGAMFFTVTLDPGGRVINTDVSRIMESQEYASNMARSLYSQNKKEGWLEKCKYTAVQDAEGNWVYVFLHRDRDVENRYRALKVSLLIGALFFVIVLIMIILVSRKMLEPVAENIEKQKSFITNASHELKTPLAIIQVNAEALELYNGKNKWTSNINEQIERLSAMLNNMLTLSRADEGVVHHTASEEVDLTSVTEELLGMYTESAEKKSITLFRHMEDSIPVRSSRPQIVQLITILLDNAVKYAMAGTTIEIHVYSRDRNTIFETVNRCQQLPECEPERLFERFYRPDSVRYSDQRGNGIGLSAARAIVGAYGGTLVCRYEGKDSIRFTVTFRR